MNESIIPPVAAGTISSCLDIEPSSRRENTYMTATSEHEWQFDLDGYAAVTGLDIGGDYPYVAQENGHSLRLITEMDVREQADGFAIHIERKAVRGTTSYTSVFWTAGAHYDVVRNDDGTLRINRESQESQPYRIRASDTEVEHRDIFRHSGKFFDSLYDLLNEIHSRPHGNSPVTELQRMIDRDSAADAIPADEYEHPVDVTSDNGEPNVAD